MDKRYQVFVSSTYTDLLRARQEVMQALLELDCIPAGMELFPAADDDQWTLIKQVIDDCDYYIVIIAGRYGSTGPSEKSFTQLEYEYAVSKGLPVIAFLHKDPGKLPAEDTEKDPQLVKKLDEFRNLAKKKMVRYWTNPTDLGSAVSRSLVKLIKNKPATGWVKSDLLPSPKATEEILELRRRVDELQRELESISTTAPKETAHLAQGEDEFTIHYSFRSYESKNEPDTWHLPFNTNYTSHSADYSVTWTQIFARISPLMVDEATDDQLKNELDHMIGEINGRSHRDDPNLRNFSLGPFEIGTNDFNTIKVQLLALRLIIKSTRNRSVKDKANYWTLTPYGETNMMELRAIKRADHQ